MLPGRAWEDPSKWPEARVCPGMTSPSCGMQADNDPANKTNSQVSVSIAGGLPSVTLVDPRTPRDVLMYFVDDANRLCVYSTRLSHFISCDREMADTSVHTMLVGRTSYGNQEGREPIAGPSAVAT